MITAGTKFSVRCGKDTVVLLHGKRRIIAEVVTTPLGMTKGLMGRRGLPRDRGMLFSFPRPGRHGIWMLGMRFPIDILFLDQDYRVLSVIRNARPMSLDPRTWKIFKPRRPAMHALEIAASH